MLQIKDYNSICQALQLGTYVNRSKSNLQIENEEIKLYF